MIVYDVHRLRLLLELHRRGTLSAVAAALRYSPSTISQQLAALEAEVGTPLLVAAEEFPHQPLPRPDGIDYRELFRDPVRLALPPGDRVDRDRVWEHVAGRPWAVEPVGTASRGWVDALCREAGFEPDVRYTTADLVVASRLVADGHAVAVLPDLLGPGRPAHLTLVELPGGPHARRIVTASRREAAGHPTVEACRRALADAAPR